jgi:hypothetical protein
MKSCLFHIAGIFVACCCSLIFPASAQVYREPEEKIIPQILERLIEQAESTQDHTDLQEQMEHMMRTKLNLNTAGRAEFEQLPFLGDREIRAILDHRTRYGAFLSIYELQTIDALDDRTLYYLSYFVKTTGDLLDDRTPLLKRILTGRNELIALHENDFQQRAGYDPSLPEQGKSHYTGSPYRYVLRYRFNYSTNLSFGYTGEKDMGEQFFRGAQRYGFDFNGAHFFVRNLGSWKAVAIGDYQANFGQGLTFGSGMSVGKSAYVLNIRRHYQVLRPYRSLNESAFLRGAAATYSFGNRISVTAFASYNTLSTNFRSSDAVPDEEGAFSSVSLSGLHRTPNEIAGRHNVGQAIFGGHMDYRNDRCRLGFTTVTGQYAITAESGGKPYQHYDFSGKHLTGAGFDYNVYAGNASFFGELSHSSNGGYAGISGVSASLHQSLDVIMLYRYYGVNYAAVMHNPFKEYGDGRNEEGIYNGISVKLHRKWQLNVYADIFRSRWLRYLTDAPSGGSDHLAELQYNPDRSTQLYVRYRYEGKYKNQPVASTPVNYTALVEKQVCRLHMQYPVTERITGRSRLELARYHDAISGVSRGTLVFQDLSYATPFRTFSLAGRIALFSVDDYTSRIYAAEQDVLYQYAVPLYQHSGIRYYAVSHIRISNRVDAWIKYSRTTYSNITVIGSGLERISGNTVSDLRVQVRIRI